MYKGVSYLALAAAMTIAAGDGATSTAWAQSGLTTIEEITVTARKRDESIREVPIFISAQSPEMLEKANISNAEAFVGRLPAISKSGDFLSPGKDFAMIVMRGVGANGGQEPAAPIFIDGVYMPRLGFDTTFADVERVEVLYGPQSTLFGRNTEAGAINIVTRRPTEEFRARVQLSADRFNTFEAKGSVSGKLADNLFGSISLEGMHTDGYLKNIGTQNTLSTGGAAGELPGVTQNSNLRNVDDPDTGRDIRARAALRYVPSDDFEVYLTADIQKFEGGFGLPGVPRGCNCYELDVDNVFLAKDKNYGGALHINWDTGAGFDVNSITGYRKLSTIQPFDFDGGSSIGPSGDPFPFGETDGLGNPLHDPEIPGWTNTLRNNIQDYRIFQEVFSQELRLTSNTDGPLQWLVGGYFYREDFLSQRRLSMLGANGFPWYNRFQDVDIDRKGWAVFGQVNYNVTDDVQVSGGLRYSKEKSHAYTIMNWFTPAFLDVYGGMDVMQGGDHYNSLNQDDLNFSVSARWNITDELSTYVTVADAFKAGGYQLAPSGDPISDDPYGPEKALSYEWGLKGNLLDNMLSFNLALFYIKLTDQQVRTITLINGLEFTREENAARSRSKGFNFDAIFRPTDNFTFNTAVGYTKAGFKEFITDTGIDLSGERARFTPRWTLNAGAEWTIPTNNSWFQSMTLYGDWRYVDKIVQGFDGISIDIQLDVGSYNIFNAGARFQLSDNAEATIYVENLTDNYIETRAWNVFFFANPGGAPRLMSTVLPPRNVGVRLTVDF